MVKANLLIMPNFDVFPLGANAARKHPNHEREASHRRDREGERPSSLAKHVTDDGSECCCGCLLHESYERRGGASAVLERRHGTGEPLWHRQSEAGEIERSREHQ